jgi:hypothetical protein
LMFEYSDYRANYPTHGMLTLSKIYAVKTKTPPKNFGLLNWEIGKSTLKPDLQN